MLVEITDIDMEFIKKEADARSRVKRLHRDKVPNKKIDQSRSDSDIDVSGVIAEYVVAKAFGIKLIPSTGTLRGDGGVYDLIFNDKLVQVKFSYYKTGKLVFVLREDFKADIAILVVPKSDKVMRICGWITRNDFVNKCKINGAFFGHYPNAYVDQSDLKPIEEFIKGE